MLPRAFRVNRQYGENVPFIVLYWDRKANLKKNFKKYDSRIVVCYAHETYNRDAYLVSTLKHSLGFPITYLIDQNRNIVTIKRNKSSLNQKATYAKALEANYAVFKRKS